MASAKRRPRPGPDPGLYPLDDAAYASWDAIYQDNVERIYRLMFAKVGNRPDAEDLTGEVFLAALPRLRTAASVGEVRAYLLTVARTTLATHWRRTLGRQITTIDPDALDEMTASSDGSVPRPGTAELVGQVLTSLPERYRTILQLRFLQAATVREAAKQMGITVANAKVLQYRALRHAAAIFDTDER